MNKIRSIFMIVLAFLIFHSGPSYAAEISTPSATPSEVNYFLAYPGILPDSPLHFLKAIRDRAVSVLINDNRKRAEFNLLTSDKRMFAGQILVEKDKTELGLITISKSNNYFHHALSAAQKAADSEVEIKDVYDKMDISMQKHIELMKKYERYFKEKEKELYTSELKRMVEMQKLVDRQARILEKK